MPGAAGAGQRLAIARWCTIAADTIEDPRMRLPTANRLPSLRRLPAPCHALALAAVIGGCGGVQYRDSNAAVDANPGSLMRHPATLRASATPG